MTRRPLENILQNLRKLTLGQEPTSLSDGQLLERFVAAQDQAAFAALMQRHGAMVLGVCRRVLRCAQDAEDACQATFLVLVRRAASIRRRDSLASWLHGVAFRIASRLQAQTRRYRTDVDAADIDPPAPPTDPAGDLTWRELRVLLDAELQRLPESLRQPLVLCYLEGKTRDEAAQQLRWSVGRLKGRLERGRRLLCSRLTRRGVTLPAVLCGAAFVPSTTSAAMPSLLVVRTLKTAVGLAAGKAPAAILPAPLVGLLETSLPAVGTIKVKALAVLLLAVALLGASAGLLGQPNPPEQEPPQPPPALVPQVLRQEAALLAEQDPLPPGAVARLGTGRLRHGGQVHSVAFAPGGKVLASAGWDWAVRLWDAATGKELHQIPSPDGWFWCVAFSPDGSLLAACGDARDGKVHLYDAATGKELRQLTGHKGNVYTVAFSPDGETLASAGADGTIRLWEVQTGVERGCLMGHKDGVRSLAFSGDGATLASGGEDATLRLWDVNAGRERIILRGHIKWIASVAFSPDGKMVTSASADGTLRLWDAATGEERRRFEGHQGAVKATAFSPDGTLVASGDAAGFVGLWEVATGREVHRYRGHHAAVTSLAFSPDGRVIASGSEDHRVRLWSVATGADLCPLSGHESWVNCVAWSPDGRLIVTGGEDHTLRLWDGATQQLLRQLPGHEHAVTATAFAPDGGLLASASAGGTIHLWEPLTGTKRGTLQQGSARLHAVAFSPDGTLLACGSADGTIALWEPRAGRLLRSWRGHTKPVRAVAFAPDGNTLASGGNDGLLCLWDLTAEAVPPPARRLTHERPVTSFAFASDGRVLASGSGDGNIHLWELETGKQRWEAGSFQRGSWGQVAVAFSPDGRYLASGTGDPVVRLWDRATGRQLQEFRGHRGWIWSLAFAPDGNTLLSGSDDTTVVCWDVASVLAARKDEIDPLDEDRLAALWAQLADDDAAVAFQAMSVLGKAPEQAVPFLRERLLDANGPGGSDLRNVWAIEVLEYVSGAEARQVLSALAQQAGESRLAADARAALKRLARLPNPMK